MTVRLLNLDRYVDQCDINLISHEASVCDSLWSKQQLRRVPMTPPLLTTDAWNWVKGNNLWITHLQHTWLQHDVHVQTSTELTVNNQYWKITKNWETQISPLCNQSPVLVHDVVPGLGQLGQVGQQRAEVVELCLLVEIFGAEYFHQLSQTDPLLEDLKRQRNTSSLTIPHFDLRHFFLWPESLCTGSAAHYYMWSQAVWVRTSFNPWNIPRSITLKTVLQVLLWRLRLDRMVQIWSENGYSGSSRFFKNTGRILTSATKTWITQTQKQTLVTCLTWSALNPAHLFRRTVVCVLFLFVSWVIKSSLITWCRVSSADRLTKM